MRYEADVVEQRAQQARSSQTYLSIDQCARQGELARDEKFAAEVLEFAQVPRAIVRQLRRQPFILWRPLASANYECARFIALARNWSRPTVIATMPEDRFSPDMNATKRRIAKLPIETGPKRYRHVSVVEFNEMRGRSFADVVCKDGTRLVDFHLDLLERLHGQDARRSVADWSAFWRGEPPSRTYPRLFATLTCFGILTESYVFAGPEATFTETVVQPCIEATVARFGVRPRIIPLLPDGDELDVTWEHYPPEALNDALRAARPCRIASQ